MTTALHTPFDLSETVKAGRRRFWKRVLPVGEINYKGRKVRFDKKMHLDLAESFHKGAYDQVPVVFADSENAHNMDPRNFGGDVLDLQPRPDGLYAFVEADEDAAKAIEKNPKLGVSARIVQGLAKGDGRKFNNAMQHLLLTMNPRVSGLGPWQAVDLSEEDAEIEVVDLTSEEYKEGSPMGKSATKTGDKSERTLPEIDLSALSDDEFQELLDFTATLVEGDPEVEDDDEIDPEEVEDEPKSKIRRKRSKTKITVEKDSEDEGPEDDDEDEDDATDLSEVVATNRETAASVRQMQIDLAESRWETERGNLEAAGVPPFFLDLAEPVLSQPEALTIDLSDDESVDATATIREMLEGVRGLVDLSDEIGHSVDLSQRDEVVDAEKATLDAWDKQYG